MDPDRPNDPLPDGTRAPDETAVAAAVRDVVDDWHLPPQRLDAVTWRDRAERRPDRRPIGLRWTRRLAAAATFAVAATIVLSVAAVWLTAPHSPSGVGSSPSVPPSGASLGPSATPAPTPLPRLALFGPLPSVTNVLVGDGSAFRIVDLTTGTASSPIFPAHGNPLTVLPRPSGGWVCICADLVTRTVADPARLTITLESVDATGTPRAPLDLRTLDGRFDPNATPIDQPQAADARVSVSPDGRSAYIGWSVRSAGVGWSAGIDVVDLDTLQMVATIALPAIQPASVTGDTWARGAPTVAESDGGRWFVSSDWYAWTLTASGTDHWIIDAPVSPSPAVVPAGTTDGARCAETGAGFVDETTVAVGCWSSDAPTIERRDLAGDVLATGTFDGLSGPEGGPSLSLHTATAAYSWDPVHRRIGRYDLATGAVTMGEAPEPTAAAEQDWLAALARGLGESIAPPATAKVFLEPGLIASPDGSRIYALGVTAARGSQGVFVFDATTLAPLDHWAPTADLTSMTISPDGRFVYAAGGAGRDARGNPSTDAASITVYDAAFGTVRLLAGDVGPSDVWFPGPRLP